jgi:hypothetical protein
MRVEDEAKLEAEIQAGQRPADPNYQLPLPVIPYVSAATTLYACLTRMVSVEM